MRFLTLMMLTLFIPFTAHAGETVTYHHNETALEGYWAPAADACDTQENYPTVLIVHQWKGLGDYEKKRADMLAAECYNGFAIDMYGQGIRPTTQEEAGKTSSIYKNDPALARGRLQAALDYARAQAATDIENIATIGYCFGGTMALEQARSGADIDGVVSFHGGLKTHKPATTDTPVLASVQVHHGAADPHVPQEDVDAFRKEIDAVDADWMLTQYADAVHAFTEKEAGDDPSTGVAYNEKADKRSWRATLAFLNEIFE